MHISRESVHRRLREGKMEHELYNMLVGVMARQEETNRLLSELLETVKANQSPKK